VESAAVGLLAGRFAAAERHGHAPAPPPRTTALGALLAHITGGAEAETFQPMNVNFGLFPPPPDLPDGRPLHGKDRKRAYTSRALADLAGWI
jgi:methylenetetrahydrofolate--tRNA-(uracil-5-)-methyltransferase